jgi:hypothetical protein
MATFAATLTAAVIQLPQVVPVFRASGSLMGGGGRETASAPPAAQGAGTFKFFPQAGTLWQDLAVPNFVDLDPTPGIQAFDCTVRAYDGHNGHDSVIVGFTEQARGVPVFAALDGTVSAMQDGHPDMNTTASGQLGNQVFIDHGGGLQTRYHHLRNGSPTAAGMTVGTPVLAGQQVGLTASSGNSTWPHLHFGTYQNGVLFEPNAGPCRPGPSNWVNQTPIPADTRLTSFTFGTGFFTGNQALPFDQVARRGTYVGGGIVNVYFRYSAINWPAGQPQFVFRRPDGTVAITANGSAVAEARWTWHHWGFAVNLNVNGTWTLEVRTNGGATLVARAPFTVVASAGQVVNRPPLPASAALEPAQPGPYDVTFCRVTPTAVHRQDPDYDVVSYRYVWQVNGVTVRDVSSAALSDALRWGMVWPGDVVRCTITPNDGVVDGPTSFADNLNQVNLLTNGNFSAGTANWLQFATPDMSYIVSQVTGGVFEFYRNPPPPGTTNQAVVFQETLRSLSPNSRVNARFRLGNSDTSRRRISVLIHDGDFSDLSVCTFWLAGGQPLVEYTMLTRTTKAWNHATISFYAASAGSTGGFYRLDDVSLEYLPGGTADRTECADPSAPGTPGGVPGPEKLVNGNFDTGVLAPWGTFGVITQQIVGGVFEFVRPTGTPAGVVLQPTNQATTAGEIVSASFQLGNSSPVAKRVTILLHDQDFSDLHACTFWLSPGQALQTYNVVTYTTEAWTNATVSFYPSTVGLHQWMRLDNVSFRSTPGATVVGTGCYEPGAIPPSAPTDARDGGRGASPASKPGLKTRPPDVRFAPGLKTRPPASDRASATDGARGL